MEMRLLLVLEETIRLHLDLKNINTRIELDTLTLDLSLQTWLRPSISMLYWV